jgi:hypothetical protein
MVVYECQALFEKDCVMLFSIYTGHPREKKPLTIESALPDYNTKNK